MLAQRKANTFHALPTTQALVKKLFQKDLVKTCIKLSLNSLFFKLKNLFSFSPHINGSRPLIFPSVLLWIFPAQFYAFVMGISELCTIFNLCQDMDLHSNSTYSQVCSVKCDLIFFTYGEQSTSKFSWSHWHKTEFLILTVSLKDIIIHIKAAPVNFTCHFTTLGRGMVVNVNTVTGQLFHMPRDFEPGLVHVLAWNRGLLFFSCSAEEDLSIICASLSNMPFAQLMQG